MTDLWVHYPETVLFVEDISTDERLRPEDRAAMQKNVDVRAFLLIPLYSSGHYHGIISISWYTPRKFSSRERYIYQTLMQSLPSIVASRRAYVAEEEARQESELLYRASRGINTASSYEEIVDAVHNLDLSSLSPALLVFENFDFDSAHYLELTAKTRDNKWVLRRKIPLSNLPVIQNMSRKSPMIIEDTTNRDQIDAVTAASIEVDGVRALIDIPLTQGEQWLGLMSFASREPRSYTKLEQRLAAGVGDMVAAALERIRLRERSDASRVRAELIAQVNAALSLSNDEQSILSAVSLLAEQYAVSLSTLAYLDIGEQGDLRAINIVALRSEDGRSPLPLSFLPVIYFRAEDYPILQVAYANPDEPTFIEDLLSDSNTEAGSPRSFYEFVGLEGGHPGSTPGTGAMAGIADVHLEYPPNLR